MSLSLTPNALAALSKTSIKPNLVLRIDGVDTIYGAIPISKTLKIGDPEFVIGDEYLIGGLVTLQDQRDYISLDGTSTKISQQLYPDKGSVSSASSVSVRLVDFKNEISELITPGVVVPDMLGRRARLFAGFDATSFPEDYVEVFKGNIDDIVSGAGNVTLNLVHPEKKKMQDIFVRKDGKLSAPITNVSATIPITDADLIFDVPYTAPSGIDPALVYCVQIDNEVIRYESATSTDLGTLTRGYLGTTAASHAANASAVSFFVLEDDVISMALKIMLSGKNGAFQSDVPATSFVEVAPAVNVANAIFFADLDLESEYGLVSGDLVSVTLATNGANNITNRAITTIVENDEGSYLVVDGAPLVLETVTSAVVSFRSQYDTLGVGLGLDPTEVDVTEHIRWSDIQLGSFSYRHYLRDTINGKSFIDEQIYAPYGLYAIPRKGKASVGYHIGPIPTVDLKTLSKDNIKSPSKISLRRTTARHFYNAIAYKYDESVLEADKFQTGTIVIDTDSRTRIPVGNAVFTVNAKGIRTDLQAGTNTEVIATRRLNRYKFAAEHFENVQTLFGTGFNLEPGDLVIVDFDGLSVTNTTDGTREKTSKFYEIINRSIDLKTGDVSLSLLDTNFDASERYGLVSPSSEIATGGDTTFAIIQDSFGALFPGDEKRKWTDYIGLPVLVHSPDFTYQEEVVFTGFDPANPYKMLFDTALGTPTVAGHVIDIPTYATSVDPNVNRVYKLIHAHQSPIVSVVSGASSTVFDVGVSDASKFFVGSIIRVHSADFSVFSPEVRVSDITGTTVTCGELGFTPSASEFVQFIGFPDREQAYRII